MDDPRFHAWALRMGRPIGGTPFDDLVELYLRWIYELRDEERAGAAVRRREQAEKQAMLDGATRRFPGSSRPVRHEVDGLMARVAAGWTRGRPELRHEAYNAVNNAIPLTRWLHHSHGAAIAVDRWTYMRHYFVALSDLTSMPVASDELLGQVVHQERLYLEAERREARARRPGLQREALLRWARKLPMNPVDNFEPGIAYYDVQSAKAREDFMDHGGSVEIDGHTVTVSYEDGKSLSFSSKTLDFRRDDITAAVALFARRHKESGRLVKFAVYRADAPVYQDLPEIDALTQADRMYLGVPYLLTPLIHARFTGYDDIVRGYLGVLKRMALGRALLVGAPIVSAGVSTTARVGTELLAAGWSAGRSATLNVTFAVSSYGLTTQAATWVGRSAWVYYLTNAVPINTKVIVGAEIAASFAGQDMGLSLGDELAMASQIDDTVRAGRRTWQKVTAQVERIEDAGNVVPLRVTQVEEIAEDVAKREYDLGTKVVATRPGASRSARGVDDAATQAKGVAVPRRPVVSPGAVAQGKRALKIPSGAIGPSVLLTDLNKAKATMVAELERFASIKRKYSPAAVNAIRGISDDAITSAGIRAQDLANLANRLSRAGVRVCAFVNDYHVVPGFEQVLLNWAKRAYWNTAGKKASWRSSKASYTGALYVIKYVTGKKLRPSALRFEWPASINDTRFGSEVTARWVDIVLSGDELLRPGATIQIELKSWTEFTLRKKTRIPVDQSTASPVTVSQTTGSGVHPSTWHRKTVGYQLIRDTALFGPESIRWIFDASKGLTKPQIILAFERVIANDPYLALQWGGKDRSPRAIRDLLDRVIDVF